MNNNKINTALGWLGCIVVMVGAVSVSLGIDPLNVYALNFGALIYGIWGYRTKQWNQVVVNGFLITVYTFGLLYRMY